jgi:hypothetical protein
MGHDMGMFQLIRRLNLEATLRYYLSVLLLVDGFDKFFNLITYWPLYLAPQLPQLTGLSVDTIMAVVGIIEITLGVVMWFSQRWGGLLIALLLFGIAATLLAGGLFINIVLIDIGLGIAALALAQATLDSPTAHTNPTTNPVE